MKVAFRSPSRLLLLALISISCVAWAQEAGDKLPRWPEWKTQVPTRVVNLRGGCSFIVHDLQGGYFAGPSDAGPGTAYVYFEVFKVGSAGTFGLPLDCTAIEWPQGEFAEAAGANQFEFNLGARQVNGQWVPVDGRARSCDVTRFPKSKRKDIDENAPCFYPDEHFKAFTFKGRNWQGTGTSLDMTTGEPKFRLRRFRYCMTPNARSDIALSGSLHVRYLNDPSSDVLPRVLKILKSVEFVDPPSPPATATVQTSRGSSRPSLVSAQPRIPSPC